MVSIMEQEGATFLYDAVCALQSQRLTSARSRMRLTTWSFASALRAAPACTNAPGKEWTRKRSPPSSATRFPPLVATTLPGTFGPSSTPEHLNTSEKRAITVCS
jgi:hypothetical protein